MLQSLGLQRVGYDLVTEQPRTNTKHNLIRTRSEKAMAPHSSTLAWKIPWMEEPGRLQSMGSQRVGLNLEAEQQQGVNALEKSSPKTARSHFHLVQYYSF